ncbi:succinate dehydrogenase assembly factor 4, mitochondrial isoform X2 [Hirundo rustica]|uniref:succinate dehydrogenase assembly factor 4, mitochondrial isoform X2 n=1 Tax=Hirundo rustica TaxID=43150 RepID=UPI0026712580|nr:succinate dehydrogenase assembly factor 4, mitochondrial isoform X2 [Hirundo rustica]
MWFTNVDSSSHLFQRCLMSNFCHLSFKKSVFWSRISSKCIKENGFCLFSESSLLCHLRSSSSSKPGGRSEPAKQPLRKPKLPVGRFDEPEESSMEKEPLEKPAVRKAALQHFFGAFFLLFPDNYY